MSAHETTCDTCGSNRIDATITITSVGHKQASSIAEGQWYRCRACGRRWFVPAESKKPVTVS